MAIGGVATNVACNVGDLGWEGPLGEGMATHSSILAWRVPVDRGAWWATVLGVAESDMTEQLSTAQLSSQCAASLNKAEPRTLGGPWRDTDMTKNEHFYRVNRIALMYFLLTTVK